MRKLSKKNNNAGNLAPLASSLIAKIQKSHVEQQLAQQGAANKKTQR